MTRIMAVDTIQTLATPHFANVSAYFINGTNETAAPPDYRMWFWNGIQIYPDLIGPLAYLLIFFIPFGMIWMSHGDVRLLCILGFLTGPFVILFLGSGWVAAAAIIMLTSVIALYWRLTRP